MTPTAQFNPLPLLSVKPGIDGSLEQVGKDLENYFSAPAEGQAALKNALAELHRVCGVLRMVSLHGVAVYCGEIEKLMQELATGAVPPSAVVRDILQRSLIAAAHYLNALVDGASNAALRLFHPYQELQQARGVEMSFEVDLFFPDLNVDLPPSVLAVPLEQDAQARIKAARSQYQQALLKWLRQTQTAEALQEMRKSTLMVMRCVPQDSRRAFWWISAGLLDCLIFDGAPPGLNAKGLLSRMDMQMKAMLDGSTMDVYATTYEMLYILARSHAVSETVEAIKQVYALDDYLPEDTSYSQGETGQRLEQMRSALGNARDVWEQVSQSEDPQACQAFISQTNQLREMAEGLARNTLQVLSNQIHSSAMHCDEPERAHRITQDMAMALLLLEIGIDQYTHLGSSFHDQAQILGQRMQAGLMRSPEDKEKFAEVIALHSEMEKRKILGPLATEMQGNLQHVEQGLNAYFTDPGKRDGLRPLVTLLHQVQAAVHLLSIDPAERLLRALKQTMERYVGGSNPAPSEMRAVALALSALEAYVQNLAHGQKSDVVPLDSAMQVLLAAQQPAPAAAPESPAVPAPAPAARAAAPAPVPAPAAEPTPTPAPAVDEADLAGDDDMLEVFLEEAQEVLGLLRTNLETSRLHLDSREPVTTMRRGFHTLKGSGRMVGLTEFGEVAWAVERAMNAWLGRNTPATPSLLMFISNAEKLFQAWVNKLEKGEAPTFEYSDLLATATKVEKGEALPPVPEAVPEPVSGEAPSAPEEAKPEPVPVPEPEPAAPETLPAGIEYSVESLAALDFSPSAPAIPAEEAEPPETLPAGVEYSVEPPAALDFSPSAPAISAEDAGHPETGIAPPPSAEALTPEQSFKLDLEAIPDLNLDIPSAPKQEPEPESVPQYIPDLSLQVEEEVKAPPAAEIPATETVEEETDEELFSISTQEAAQNVAELRRHFAALRASSVPEISYDFMRAAHTLGGVYRAMGFGKVAVLAQALELWLQEHMERSFTLTSAQLELLEKAIQALHDIGEAVSNRLPFKDQSALIELLRTDMAKAGAGQPAAPEPQSDQGAPQEGPAATGLAQDTPSLPGATLRPAPVPEPPARVAPPQAVVAPAPRAGATAPAEAPPAPRAPAVTPAADASEKAAPAAAPVTRQAVEVIADERVVRDDLDEQLLPIFLEESADLYTQISSSLRSWIENPAETGFAQTLQRSLHTLKGSARMVGAMRLGELTHLTESHVQKAAKDDPAFWEELDSFFDRIGNTLERLRSGTPEEIPAETPEVIEGEAAVVVQRPELAQPETATGSLAAAMLRVRSDMVDFLVNEAGEISVVRSRIEIELRTIKTGLLELTNSVERLRKQLREIEIQAEGQMQARVSVSQETEATFDPLEFDRFTQFQDLTRSMNESVHDVQTVQQALLKSLDETTTALGSQALLNRELQQSLMSIRMVPFATLSERLYRIIRRTGKELGKRVNLELLGGDIELDRSMLEKMTAPFEHLLRNSIDHGLESTEEREKKGKPPIGEIRLALRQENNEVVFEFTDDGAGLDTDRLYKKALEQGIYKPGETVSDNQIMQVIFATGLSTADRITEISGRGVGMDVVRSDIMALGGRIDVSSERGKGVRFMIRLPLTLAVAQTLMVQAAHETYAINSGMIEQILQVKHAELVDMFSKGETVWNENHYPLFNLTRLLGNDKHQPESRAYNPILLLRSGDRRMALHVDELVGSQEVVVKNIGPQLARLPGIAGATVLGNGRVVLILNPITMEQYASGVKKLGEAKAVVTPVTVAAAKLMIMVVDDSLTVRKVTSRMLVRSGYQVVTATDGVDALEKLAEYTPDMMLLDIEMPRMDGFELTKRLRSDPRFKHLPIIIITSRAAEKHRLYALELGVNAYLGKPYQEMELLEHVKFYSEEELHQHANFHRAEGLLHEIASFIAPKMEDAT